MSSNNGSSPLPDPPSNFSIDNSLSKELLKLSFKDRTAIEEEIHGVRCLAPEETPELLECALRDFDSQLMARKRAAAAAVNGDPKMSNLLRNIISTEAATNTNTNTNTITTATTSNTTNSSFCYLNDPNIRLRFLRCECFVVNKAVQRFVDFLEHTSELFGDFVAERPISLMDFFNTRKEEVALHNSRNQYLPFRDRSGRRVFVGVGSCGFDLDPILRFKIIMYLHWVASEDVETQRKGVVIIAWPSNEDDEEGNNANNNTGNINNLSWEKTIRPGLSHRYRLLYKKQDNAMPLRVTSQQAYYKDTPFFRALSTLYFVGMNSHHRSLYKAHYGTLCFMLCFVFMLSLLFCMSTVRNMIRLSHISECTSFFSFIVTPNLAN